MVSVAIIKKRSLSRPNLKYFLIETLHRLIGQLIGILSIKCLKTDLKYGFRFGSDQLFIILKLRRFQIIPKPWPLMIFLTFTCKAKPIYPSQFDLLIRGHRTMKIYVQCSNVRSCSTNIRTREHGFEKTNKEQSKIERFELSGNRILANIGLLNIRTFEY